MKKNFQSKVFIENRTKQRGLKILVTVLCLIIVLCLLVKIIVGDFKITDLSGFIIPLLIIFSSGLLRKSEPVYAPAAGEIEFGTEEMKIAYANVDGGKETGVFSEENIIRYDEIESIEYGEALKCYRIRAVCLRKRYFQKFQKEKIMEDATGTAEIFMYVLNPQEETDIRKWMQKSAGRLVTVYNK